METLIFLIRSLLGSLEQVESKSDDSTATKSSGTEGLIVGAISLSGFAALAAQESKLLDGLLSPLLLFHSVNGNGLLLHARLSARLLNKSEILTTAEQIVIFPANGIHRGNIREIGFV